MHTNDELCIRKLGMNSVDNFTVALNILGSMVKPTKGNGNILIYYEEINIMKKSHTVLSPIQWAGWSRPHDINPLPRNNMGDGPVVFEYLISQH